MPKDSNGHGGMNQRHTGGKGRRPLGASAPLRAHKRVMLCRRSAASIQAVSLLDVEADERLVLIRGVARRSKQEGVRLECGQVRAVAWR